VTRITLQDGKIVLRDGKVGTEEACCCGCAACPYCSASCLEIVLSGWSGSVSGCDCADINGTYLLSRGTGVAPTATVTVTDSTGSGAVIQATLAFNPATGTFFVTSATVISAGDDYSSEASAAVSLVGGTVECDKNPQLTLERENVEPTTDFFLDVDDALGGAGDALTVVWAPENTTPGSETWKVDSVTVSNGGTGFDLWQTVRIPSSLINDPILPIDSTQSSLIGFTSVDRAVPVIASFSVVDAFGNPSGGSGASFSVVWEIDDTTTDFLDSVQPGADNRFWRIVSVTVLNGGSGYAAGDVVRYTLNGRHVDTGMANSAAADYVLDGLGVSGGEFVVPTAYPLGAGPTLAKSNGTIQSVVITQPGEWYQQSGITGVIIDNPGSIVASGGSVDLPEGALPGCAYTRCEQITCGEQEVCLSVSLVATEDSYILNVAINGEAVASASKSSEDASCDSIEFTSEDFEGPSCSPGTASVSAVACDTGPPEEACCDEEEKCSDCLKNCCLIIRGRNLCEPDSVQDENGVALEQWAFNTSGQFYLWQAQDTAAGGGGNVIVIIGPCGEDGIIPLFIESNASDAGGEIAHQWFDARASLGPDGCPNGVVFGDMTVACGFSCGSKTPLDPEISFECSEFDPFFE
jgi:hypothetical protein